MRIQITDEGRDLRIWLPSALLFNDITAEIAVHSMRKYTSASQNKLSSRQMRALFAELRCTKKKYGSWTLVDVEEADGQKVKIIL